MEKNLYKNCKHEVNVHNASCHESSPPNIKFKKSLYLLDFFLDTWSVSEVEELESRFSFLLFAFFLLESTDVELEVELESSLLELDSVVLLEVADVDEELLMPCAKQMQQWKHFFT